MSAFLAGVSLVLMLNFWFDESRGLAFAAAITLAANLFAWLA